MTCDFFSSMQTYELGTVSELFSLGSGIKTVYHQLPPYLL